MELWGGRVVRSWDRFGAQLAVYLDLDRCTKHSAYLPLRRSFNHQICRVFRFGTFTLQKKNRTVGSTASWERPQAQSFVFEQPLATQERREESRVYQVHGVYVWSKFRAFICCISISSIFVVLLTALLSSFSLCWRSFHNLHVFPTGTGNGVATRNHHVDFAY